MAVTDTEGITALLQREGWEVNHKRVERLWRREGLKVPQKQPKRKRLWLNDGSCIRLRPLFKDHVWRAMTLWLPGQKMVFLYEY